ncbi:secretory phospholipase A2 receptor-like isoform X2 [Hydractinia symbiolongicarpus]|uniref:secretory phospholipase A2 receptor-like isoform X2 n=1 Tax=Hydractinia symbiolongicarpus TaxID=13093 RepID=UPI00254A03D4|nr:secretory phospholipase A2 receptor-like isoform X2 [Hydractinia symbiolongicarpus]
MILWTFVSLLVSYADATCPSLNVSLLPIGKKCFYFFFDTTATWRDAEIQCNVINGHLASIQTEQELVVFQNLSNHFNSSWASFWIGGNDLLEEGKFSWSDGSKMFYSFWANAQPENVHDDQDCMNIDQYGFWRDNKCSQTKPYICKKSSYGMSCPIGWEKFEKSCYKGQVEQKFFVAKATCESQNSTITSILSPEENDYIKNRIGDKNHLGLVKGNDDGKYEWLDGSPFNYTNWSVHQIHTLNKHIEDCVMVSKSGKWFDTNCSESLSFACKVEHGTKMEIQSPRIMIATSTTVDYYLSHCLITQKEGTSLQKCFQLCRDHGCVSFSHSSSGLCVLNGCVEKFDKMKTAAVGQKFAFYKVV